MVRQELGLEWQQGGAGGAGQAGGSRVAGVEDGKRAVNLCQYSPEVPAELNPAPDLLHPSQLCHWAAAGHTRNLISDVSHFVSFHIL